ncbi:MAG: Sensor histidine kinase [Frankiales bacterium]|nr:Sensor histidine kinase [Frankiales bacterium]
MLPLLRPTAMLRLLPPQRGAVANARDGARVLDRAARERHELGRSQARALGTVSWSSLGTGPGRHALHVGRDDADVVSRLAGFVAEGLADGDVCVVAVTPSHRAGVRRRLDLAGLSPAVDGGLLVDVDAAGQLACLLRDGHPAEDLFERHVARRLRARVASGQRLRVAGETVGLLAQDGQVEGAVALERMWGGLQDELDFPLLCATPALAEDAESRVFAEHTHVVTTVG